MLTDVVYEQLCKIHEATCLNLLYNDQTVLEKKPWDAWDATLFPIHLLCSRYFLHTASQYINGMFEDYYLAREYKIPVS